MRARGAATVAAGAMEDYKRLRRASSPPRPPGRGALQRAAAAGPATRKPAWALLWRARGLSDGRFFREVEGTGVARARREGYVAG